MTQIAHHVGLVLLLELNAHRFGGNEEVLEIHDISNKIQDELASLHDEPLYVETADCPVVAVPVSSYLPHLREPGIQLLEYLLVELRSSTTTYKTATKLISQGAGLNRRLEVGKAFFLLVVIVREFVQSILFFEILLSGFAKVNQFLCFLDFVDHFN